MTSGGRILRRRDKLESCEVRDGSIVEVTSRMRGGGKHKDKKSKSEKKQTTNPEQKSEEEPKRGKGPSIQECDRDTVVQMIEESEDNRKMIENICEGNDVEVEQALQNYRAAGREVLGWDQGQADLMERGFRWAVEARRRGRRQQEEEQRRRGEQEQRRQAEQGQKTEQEQGNQGKQVRFGEEQQLVKTGAENAGEPSAGFVRGEMRGVSGGRGQERQRKG